MLRQLWVPRQILGVGLCTALLLSGCDLNKMMADAAGGLTNAAAQTMVGYWDAELAMDGAPAGIMQLEAMHAISPNNEELNTELAKAYIGYGYAVVELGYEKAEAEGELEKSDRLRQRARLIYQRARDLGLMALRAHADDGIDTAIEKGDVALAGYLAENFPEVEDLYPVLWAAIAWGSLMNVSGDFPDTLADAPLVKALAAHIVKVEPAYGDGAALAFLGGFECAFPEMFGGSIEKGTEYFERALELTERRSHTVHLQFARLCALNSLNRKLYVKLLMEIIEAPDQGNAVRIANKIARHRAEFYLARVDDELPQL